MAIQHRLEIVGKELFHSSMGRGTSFEQLQCRRAQPANLYVGDAGCLVGALGQGEQAAPGVGAESFAGGVFLAYQIKKIIGFTLLMKGGLPAGSLFDNIMEAPWFGETVSLFFGKERPRPVFDRVVDELIQKGSVIAEGAVLFAVKEA